MKKNFFFLFFISFLTSEGQSYNSLLGDTTEWNVVLDVLPVIHERSFFDIVEGNQVAWGDTIIGGLNYKIFEQQWWSLIGYMREDTSTQKVWFREDAASPELLLYDFSLNQNDSVFLTFPNYISGDAFPTGWYYVDSVVTRNITIGSRKFYYLSNPASPVNMMDNGNRFYLVWIEGIGRNIHPAYIYLRSPEYGPLSDNCPVYFRFALACEHKDGVQQFFDTCFWNNYQMFATDSCHYSFPGGINEQNSSSLSRSEEHTSELQSLTNLVCRLLLEKKKKKYQLQDAEKYTFNLY